MASTDTLLAFRDCSETSMEEPGVGNSRSGRPVRAAGAIRDLTGVEKRDSGLHGF